MFNLDLMVLNIIRRLYDTIFQWPDNAFYGAGAYFKYIICLIAFQQCFNIAYSFKTKKKIGVDK